MFNKEGKKIQNYLEDSLQQSFIHLYVIQRDSSLQVSITSRDGREDIGWDGLRYLIRQYAQVGVSKEEIFATITVNDIQLDHNNIREFWRQYGRRL